MHKGGRIGRPFFLFISGMSTLGPFDVHVVSHTHWDREWYLSFPRFRQRLVALVDELLDAPLERSAFLLDGQAILLNDYLTVRPDRERELGAALARGAIEAGPWYVLADELLTSGEALVRNLLAGRRAVRALGGEPLDVLYCPDSFGHPSDLPTLAEGFGLPLIILWRGLGGPVWPEGDAFAWRAPGGARVLLHHLPPSGYEYGANLPADEARARERWRGMREVLASRARTSALLVLNGADHHARQSRLNDAISALSRVAPPDRVRASTLSAFTAAFVEGAAVEQLPEIEGELRFSPGYTWTVPGTWSSRGYQKRRNARIERLLTREAEVWAAIAAARGARPRGPLLHAAWRTLLECHPHDTLCGCSEDAVARAADERLSSAAVEARGIAEDAVLDVMRHDAAEAHVSPTWSSYVLARNAAARARGGVAEVEITRVIAPEPVGPGSAGVPVEERQLARPTLEGGSIPLQILDRRTRSDRIESPRHYPRNDRVEVARCVAWIDTVPGYGIAPVQVDDPPVLKTAERLPVNPVRATEGSLDNGILRLEPEDGGALRLQSLLRGHTWRQLIRFEDVGDAGDLYTHSPIRPTVHEARLIEARVTHDGPLRAQLRLRFALDLPVSSTREGRSRQVRRNDIAVILTLNAGAPFVRVGVHGVNRVRDHRLRIVFATDVREGVTLADGMFGPVARASRVQPPETLSMELVPATAPLARWVSRKGASYGLAIISDGLGEYEVLDDGAIAVTLVRAVGALSRNDLPERPGHAGWPVPTPGAQCIGRYRGEFALFPHGVDDDVIGDIERAADDVLLPLRGWTLRSAIRPLEPVAGLTLEGDGLRFLACKPSENGAWTVLRCVNVTSRPATGSWRCAWALREARRARLDETPGEALRVRDGGAVDIQLGPLAVATLLVR